MSMIPAYVAHVLFLQSQHYLCITAFTASDLSADFGGKAVVLLKIIFRCIPFL